MAGLSEELDSDYEMSEEELEPSDLSDVDISEEPIEHLRTWTSGPHVPIVYEFDDFQSGIANSDLTETSPECLFFEHFLNRDIMLKVVQQTNIFFHYQYNTQELGPKSRSHNWIDTTVSELYAFFAVSMLMTRNKHLSLEEHWSTDCFLSAPIFGQTMPRDRYELLLQMLHFSDPTSVTSDRLNKIRLLLEHTRKIFKDTMIPHQNLCIDESIIVFKGRLIFKQFIPSKRHRFGIKMFVLCDVMTGYILDFIIYCGDGTDIVDSQNFGISGAVVTTLLTEYLGKGHSLWCDNWYTGPQLFKHLHENKTNACGTVRKNRKEMPCFKKLKKGETEVKSNSPLLALKWCDRRDVHMLTTMHDDSFGPTGKTNFRTGEPIMKPKCILEYNKNMGTVDKADMMLSSLSCMRKSVKWYKKVAFHMIDLYLLNSFYMYKSVTGSKKTLGEFQLVVIKQLVAKYAVKITKTPQPRPSTSENPLRLLPRTLTDHLPEHIPPTANNKKPRRRCHVCGNSKINKKKTSLSRYMCCICNVALCLSPCYKIYHSSKQF